MAEMNEDMQKELIEFQKLQQQLQMIAMQKQQTDLQVSEIDRAFEETGKAKDGEKLYRYFGGVLVPKEKESIQTDLKEEKEKLELRSSVLGKQESKFTERMQTISKKVNSFLKSQNEGEGAAI